MFNPTASPDTKIAVLEERLSSYEVMMRKIDEAIQIMGKTSQNISKMLAVHEEKLDQCNKTDDLISKMIEDFKKENREQHNDVSERVDAIEKEVKEISKIKWMTVGCGVILSILTAALASLASGWWSPSTVQQAEQPPQQVVPANPARR